MRGAPALGVAGALGVALAALPHPAHRGRRRGRADRRRPAHRRQPRRGRPPGARRAAGRAGGRARRRAGGAGRGRRGLPRHRRRAAPRCSTELCGPARCGCTPTATRARWPASSGAPRSAWSGRCTRAAGSATSWPTRRARCCRAPGSPRVELATLGIAHRVVVDGAGPSVIARGLVDAVVVGADRIAANGDVANKIGTYPLALAAARAGHPVRRGRAGVHCGHRDAGRRGDRDRGPRPPTRCCLTAAARAPGGAAWNPAFDVTPADLVTAIVTESRVITAWTPAAGSSSATR